MIVWKHVEQRVLSASDFEDNVQSVFESLLTKIHVIQQQYRGMSLFSTYLSAVVRNECLRLGRLDRRRVDTAELRDTHAVDAEESGDEDSIATSVRTFEHLLKLYGESQPKVLFCLKLYYRIPINLKDITDWYPRCSAGECKRLVGAFGKPYDGMSDYEICTRVTRVMNLHYRKGNKPDALRKYIDTTIRDIIAQMNKQFPGASFDKESLRVLIENHFFPHLRIS
jgi:hypothetical protein